MARHEYMIREDYVRNWRVQDALRELIANALDAEVEQGAAASVTHLGDEMVITNRGVRLDVQALYLGGTSKAGSTQTIGQYGEGMKLALLVLVRNNFNVKIENDYETWTPVLETDKNGVRAFAINTRTKKVPSGNLVITIEGVSDDLFYQATQMFLKLNPPKDVLATTEGEILLDPDREGHVYARGVYITKISGAMAGYNLKELEVSRDRRSYEQYQLNLKVQSMWGQAATRPEAARKVFDGFLNGASDLHGASWITNVDLAESMVKVFQARYGDNALPIFSTGEGVELEHLGAKGVVVPSALVSVLRRKLQTPQQFKAEHEQRIVQQFSFDELTQEEQRMLRLVLHDLARIGCNIECRVTVVQFGSPAIEGLHRGEQILLSRLCLQTYGKTAGVLLHEAAHDEGVDASKAHVDQIHTYMEALLTLLAKQRQLA